MSPRNRSWLSRKMVSLCQRVSSASRPTVVIRMAGLLAAPGPRSKPARTALVAGDRNRSGFRAAHPPVDDAGQGRAGQRRDPEQPELADRPAADDQRYASAP